MFADDLLLFGQANIDQMRNVMFIQKIQRALVWVDVDEKKFHVMKWETIIQPNVIRTKFNSILPPQAELGDDKILWSRDNCGNFTFATC
jgi:hypothetical protein